jgi:glyoxylase-like metal-dependent hydrolase (beta-lactamase superfamily II)
VLIDTGLGTADVADARGRLGAGFVALTAPSLSRDETAIAHVERLGYKREDVRHIVPTHLDLDHAGGLADFPDATVHIFRKEYDAAMTRATRTERERYKPVHWAHGPKWQVHDVAGDTWLGFESVKCVGQDVLLVPMIGHTRGHCAVAVRTAAGWLMHAGDAYCYRGEMHPTAPTCTPGLAAFQKIIAIDNDARVKNCKRLRELLRDHASSVRIFCAHDPRELDEMTAAAIAANETLAG